VCVCVCTELVCVCVCVCGTCVCVCGTRAAVSLEAPQVGTILLSVEDILGDGVSPAPAHLTAAGGDKPHVQPSAEQVQKSYRCI
jgi:hypothetical protein